MRELSIVKKDSFPARRTFSCGSPLFSLAANPTDVALFGGNDYSTKNFIKKVRISGFADTSSCVEIMLQMSGNGGGGTLNNMSNAPFSHISRTGSVSPQLPANAYVAYWTTNPANRNGISSDRPVLSKDILQFSTSTTRGNTVVFDFSDKDIFSMPSVATNVEWIVVNLNAQTMPANAKLQVTFEYEQVRMPRISMCGDSTYSHATQLMQNLTVGNGLFDCQIDNLGCNGQTLSAFITPASTGIAYPIPNIGTRTKDIVVVGYGINDVRMGSTSQTQLTNLLNTAINNILTINRDAKIVLHGSNSLCTDDPTSSNWITTTGLFSGMTLAQAAQEATNIMYNAYESFRNDGRIAALVQRQDVTGRTSVTVAQSGLMTDQLHPNERGQRLIAKQLKSVLEKIKSDLFLY